MFEKGQILDLEITDMSDTGQGIGKADGLAVFVSGAVIGDKVKARLTKVKKRYAFAETVSVQVPSVHRISPQCPYHSKCGGCDLGEIDYEMQLKLKEDHVRQKLIRLGGLKDPVIEPVISMGTAADETGGPSGFRNKAVLSVSTGGIITEKGGVMRPAGKPAAGFMRRGTRKVTDCRQCLIQCGAVTAAADALRRFMEEDIITAWDPRWEKGLMRNMIVRTAFGTGEVMVILVINGKGILGAQKLIRYLDESIYAAGYSLESVIVNPNTEKNGPVMGEDCMTLAGKNTITEKAGKLDFEISPRSFYQTNPVMMEALYDTVLEFADLKGDETVLDLYCGTGTIGLWCADKAGFIIGIESEKQAVLDANRNAVINGITNAAFICGKAEEELPELLKVKENEEEKKPGDSSETFRNELAEKVRTAKTALLDPPRAGCSPELLKAIASSGIEQIIYVSCDAATLARDVRVLEEHGFSFIKARPVDMFPRSSHVESVCLLSKIYSNER